MQDYPRWFPGAFLWPCYTLATVLLAWIFEFWKWTDSDWLTIGVLMLVYGAYGVGFASGRYPYGEHDSFGEALSKLPVWVQLAFLFAIVGFVIVLGTAGGDCSSGQCAP